MPNEPPKEAWAWRSTSGRWILRRDRPEPHLGPQIRYSRQAAQIETKIRDLEDRVASLDASMVTLAKQKLAAEAQLRAISGKHPVACTSQESVCVCYGRGLLAAKRLKSQTKEQP